MKAMTFTEMRDLSAKLRAEFGATGRDLYIDQALSQVALDLKPEGFIGDRIFPIADVAKQSGLYTIFNRADVLRVEDTRRAPGTAAHLVGRRVSSDTYFADNYALAYPVTVEDMANADPIMQQKIINGRATFLTNKLLLDWDNRVLGRVTPSNVGTSSGVTVGWATAANTATPVEDVFAIIDHVKDITGLRPNRLLWGDKAWRSFRRHDNVRDYIYGANNGGGLVTENIAKELFEVQDMLVARAYKDTTNEGQAGNAVESILADHVVAYYAPMTASTDEYSWGYSFRWNLPGMPAMMAERIPIGTDRTKSEYVEVGYYQDEKITGSDFAAMLVAVNSSSG